MVMLRISGQTLPVFEERLAEASPDRARKVWSAIEEMRGGKRNETDWRTRMVGRGPRWQAIDALFDMARRRLGINADRYEAEEDDDPVEDDREEPSPFRRPSSQGELFPEGSG